MFLLGNAILLRKGVVCNVDLGLDRLSMWSELNEPRVGYVTEGREGSFETKSLYTYME